MKKKNKKNSIEVAIEVVNTLKETVDNTLKETVDNLQEKGEGTSVIKTLETSVRKIEKMKKEVIALKEKLRNKKFDLNQEQETMWELVRTEKKLLKNKPQKPEKHEKKEKIGKKEKKQKPEEKAEESK
jgi:hypothetical protein